MTMQRAQLEAELNNLLQPQKFRDYCPNGLQVEGSVEISKLVTGVTASDALIEEALDLSADCLLVHHGYFWRNEDQTITGIKKNRLCKLLANQINLFAYHLPLDVHEELGNNAQLGKLLGFVTEQVKGRPDDVALVAIGRPAIPLSLGELQIIVEGALKRKPVVIGNPLAKITRIAWCTGAAQSYFDLAIEAGVDAFITGEISEPSAHLAHESGVAFISAGHHATERYGVQAVGDFLAQEFALEHHFVDIENPA